MADDLQDFDQLFGLGGKVALVTGGSKGIGFWIANALLRSGCSKVIITARNADTVATAVKKLNGIPNIKGHAIGIPSDVSKTEDIESLVKKVEKETSGKVHILIANAASVYAEPFDTFDDKLVADTLNVNVRGIFNLAKWMTPLLAAAGTEADPARIIITCSVAGHVVTTTGERSSIMYGVSKAGCLHLSRNLAMELSSRHITSNTISPGFTETESAKEYLEGEYKGQLNLSNPLGRLARAEDMAGAVIYLCSRAGAYVNAVDITLDGGGRWRAGAFS